MKKLRILLADDHAVLRAGLSALLNAQPDMEIVGEAENGKEACIKAQELKPDIVVMDVSMPEWNGAQATEGMKRACPEARVLALSAHEDEVYLRQLLKAGAVGYVLKRAAADELAHAIRQIAGGAIYVDRELAGKALASSAKRATDGDIREIELSEREEEVLRLIAWGHTNKEIAEKLYLSVKTIETYKARLMEKRGLSSRADIVRYALRRGWLKET